MRDEGQDVDAFQERRPGPRLYQEEETSLDGCNRLHKGTESGVQPSETDTSDPLMDQLRQEAETLDRRVKVVVRLLFGLSALSGLYSLTLFLLLCFAHRLPPPWMIQVVPPVMASLCIVPPLSILPGKAKLRRLKQVLLDLTESEDIRAITTLVAAGLDERDDVSRARLIRALTRLLPRLRATDASLLPPRSQAHLYRVLEPGWTEENADFQIAILNALGKVGDDKALPYVQRLVDREPVTTDQQRVLEVARDCLVSLPLWAERRRKSDMLVRASMSPEVPADTLLRPALGGAPTDPALLLRPGPPEESE